MSQKREEDEKKGERDPEDGVVESKQSNEEGKSRALRNKLCGAIVFTSTSCFWCSLSILITSIVGGIHETVCLTTHLVIFIASIVAGIVIWDVSISLAKVEL